MPKFTIDWPNETFDQDKEDFLRVNPNQTLNEGEENLTDGQWIKRKIMLWLKGQVIRGRIERLESAREKPIEPEITII